MPDIQNIPYNYNNELIDTGGFNLPPLSNGAPVKEAPEAKPLPSIMDIIGNSEKDVINDHSWLKKNQYNIPTNVRLSDTERYNDPEYGFNAFNPNIETQYGDREGWLKGIGKSIVHTGANVLGGFIQTIATIPNVMDAAFSGDLSKVYDNPINNDVNDMLSGLDTYMPIYKTTFEENHPVLNYIPFVGNGWSKVMENIGFVGGAILGSVVQDALVGAVTGGVGETPLIAQQITNISSRLGKVFAGGGKAFAGLTDALSVGKDIEQTVNTASTLSKIATKGRYALALQTGAWSQAAMMAGHTHEAILDELKADYFDKHGYDASGSDLERINTYAHEGANTDLLATGALLSIVDAIQFPTILKPFNAAKRSLETTLETGERATFNTATKSYEIAPEITKGARGLANKLMPTGRLLTSTGLESTKMGSQVLFQRSAQDFYKRKFDDDSIGTVDNLNQSLTTGLKYVMFSPEGMESTLMGGLIGIGIHGLRYGAEKIRGLDNNKASVTNRLLTLMNSHTAFGTLGNHYDEAVTQMSIQNDMRRAVQSGDVFEYKNLQHQSLFESVHSAMKANKFDARMKEWDMMKELSPEEFKSQFGMEFSDGNKQLASDYIDSVKRKALEIKKTVDKVNTAFKNPYREYDKIKEKPKREDEYIKFSEYEDAQKQMALDLSEVKDNRRRINKLGTEIRDILPNADVEKVVNLTSEEGVKQTIKDFKERISDLQKDETLLKGSAKERIKATNEREFLEKKIVSLSSFLKEDYNPATFMRNAHEIIDYHAGFPNEGVSNVDKIDIGHMLQKAGDIYKLGENSKKAYDSFETLTKPEKLEAFVKKVSEMRQKVADRLGVDKDGNIIDKTKQTTDGKEPGVGEGDENGNPVEEAPKAPAEEVLPPELTEQEAKDLADLEAKTEETDTKTGKKTKKDKKELTLEEQEKLEALKAKKQAREAAKTEAAAKKSGVTLSTTETTDNETDDTTPRAGGKEQNPKATDTQGKSKVTANIAKKLEPKAPIYKRLNPVTLLNNIFSANREGGVKEKDNLRDVIFDMSPVELGKKVSLKISENTFPNSKKKGEYSDHPQYPNILRDGSNINAELVVDGKVIGRLQEGDSLFYKKDGKVLPLSEIPKEDYEEITGNAAESHQQFIDDIKAYKELHQKIVDAFTNGKTEFTPEELSKLVDFIPNYGTRKQVKYADEATPLNKLKYKGKGDVVLSFPVKYNPETGVYERNTQPVAIGEESLDDASYEALQKYITDNIDLLHGLNSRYIYVQQMPDGLYKPLSTIAARPVEANAETLTELVNTIKSIPENPTKDQLRSLNTKLRNDIYIADMTSEKGSGNQIFLKVTPEGDLNLNVFNAQGRPKTKWVTIKNSELKSIEHTQALVNKLNTKLADTSLSSIKLSKESFKTNIPNDGAEGLTVESIADKLTVATPPFPYERQSLAVVPEGRKVETNEPKPPVERATKDAPRVKEFSSNKLARELRLAYKKEYGQPLPLSDWAFRKLGETKPIFETDGKLNVPFVAKALNIDLAGAAKIVDSLGNVRDSQTLTRRVRPENLTKSQHEVLNTIELSDNVPQTIKDLADKNPVAAIQELAKSLDTPVTTTQEKVAEPTLTIETPKVGDVVNANGTEWTYRVSDTVSVKGEKPEPTWMFKDAKGNWQNAGKSDMAKIDAERALKTEEASLTLRDELGEETSKSIETAAKIAEPLKIKKLDAQPAPNGALEYDFTSSKADKPTESRDSGFGKVYLLVDDEVKQDFLTPYPKAEKGDADYGVPQSSKDIFNAEDYLKAFAYENRERENITIDLRGLTPEEIKEKLKYLKTQEHTPEVKKTSQETLSESQIKDKHLKPIPQDVKSYYGWLSEIQQALLTHKYDELLKEGKLTEEEFRNILRSTERNQEADDVRGLDAINEPSMESQADVVMYRVEHPEIVNDAERWKNPPKKQEGVEWKAYLKDVQEAIKGSKNGKMYDAIDKGVLSPEEAQKILDTIGVKPQAISDLIKRKFPEFKAEQTKVEEVKQIAKEEANFDGDIKLERKPFNRQDIAPKEGIETVLPKLTINEEDNQTNIGGSNQGTGRDAGGESSTKETSEKKEDAVPKKAISVKMTQDVEKLISDYEDGDVSLTLAGERARRFMEKNEEGIRDNMPEEYKKIQEILKKSEGLKPKELRPEVKENTEGEIKKGDTVVYKGEEKSVEDVMTGSKGSKFLIIDGRPVREEDVTLPEEKTPAMQAFEDSTDSQVLSEVTEQEFVDEKRTANGEELSDSEDHDELLLTYTGLKTILERLKNKFGVDYKIVDSNHEYFKGNPDSRGRFKDGKVFINIDTYNKDTAFHEYLHPFIKSIEVDNPELYNKLHELLAEDPEGQSELRIAKKFYKEDTEEEQRDEALIAYLSKRMADMHTSEGLRKKSAYWDTFKDLISKFRLWLSSVIWGHGYQDAPSVKDKERMISKKVERPQDATGMRVSEFSNYGYHEGPAEKGQAQVTTKNKFIDQMTLKDFTGFVAMSDVQFDLSNTLEVIKRLDRFQKDTSNTKFENEILNRLQKRIATFSDTANRRTPSAELQSHAADLHEILSSAELNEDLGVTKYIQQGIVGLSFAKDEMSRIGRTIRAGQLTQKDVLNLQRRLGVVKNFYSMYDDVAPLWRRIIAPRVDSEEYKETSLILDRANDKMDNLKTMNADLITEWLYPFLDESQYDLKAKHPDRVLTKEQFRNKLYNADSEPDTLLNLLGSIGSSKDPVNAIVKTALINVFKANNDESHRINTEVQEEYSKFLKDKGLANDRKATSEYYKQNYLRKASHWEKTGEDAEGNAKYGYVDRWAFHEEFYHDKYEKELNDFKETLGEEPDHSDKAAYKAWGDKILQWQLDNTQERKTGRMEDIVDADNNVVGQRPEIERVPVERFRNAEFTKLQSDPFFKKLYTHYKTDNETLGEDGLKHGIIPQVSQGKEKFADLKWSKGLGNLKEIGKGIARKFEGRDNTISFTGEDNQEYNFGVNDMNLDGSIYKRVKHPYTRLLDESDLDTVLVESVLKYNHAVSVYRDLKTAEPNITALRELINGNDKLGLKGRMVNATTSKNRTIFDRFLKLPQNVDKQSARLNTQLNSFIDDVVYGESEIKDNLQLGKYTFSLNKLGRNLGLLTALNNMAFNVGGGIANSTIGNIQSLSEAVGGKYYSKKDWWDSHKEYWRETKNFVADVTAIKKSPVTQLLIMYDALQGEFRDKWGKNIVGSAAQRYANLDSIFFINHIAEHEIQTKFTLAMMRGQKVRTTGGDVISLRDAYVPDAKGYMKLRDDAIWTEADKQAFMRRLHSKNYELNGNYSDFDKAQIQRRWYGKMALIYRKYLYNAFRARFGQNRVDYELGDVTEGSYRAFFGKLASDIKQYKFDAARRFLTREGWNADQKYAYNKTVYELSMLAGVSLLAMGIQSSAQKKDASWAEQEAFLRLLNLRSDLGQYTILGIPDMVRIMQNPSVIMNTMGKYANFFTQLITDPTAVYKQKSGIFSRGDSKLKATFLKAFPGVRQVVNILQPDEQAKFFQMTSGSK